MKVIYCSTCGLRLFLAVSAPLRKCLFEVRIQVAQLRAVFFLRTAFFVWLRVVVGVGERFHSACKLRTPGNAWERLGTPENDWEHLCFSAAADNAPSRSQPFSVFLSLVVSQSGAFGVQLNLDIIARPLIDKQSAIIDHTIAVADANSDLKGRTISNNTRLWKRVGDYIYI